MTRYVLAMMTLLIALQFIQVAFLWLHDWVPVAPLNDVRAVRAADSAKQLVFVTLVQSVPFTIGLWGSVMAAGGHRPGWLWTWLWVSYAMLFAGEIRAWWIPYLVRPEPGRALRYRAMFGRTHAFLPERNGIVPNTLHCLLHAATALTVLVLAFVSSGGG